MGVVGVLPLPLARFITKRKTLEAIVAAGDDTVCIGYSCFYHKSKVAYCDALAEGNRRVALQKEF
jgi:hypothetical protein